MSSERVTRLGAVNCFLVSEPGGLTLIDTTIAGSAAKIIDAADALGSEITRILLTHAHSDHVGSLDALAERLPDAEVLISAREAKLLGGDKTLEPGEPAEKPRGGFPKVATEPSGTFGPGERVGSFEVVPSPGHTPGHVALLDTRDRTLYCGDAFSTLGGVSVPARPYPRFPLPYFATWHRPMALQSARELLELEPARLAPGHGKVVEAPAEEMRRAIERAS